MIAATEEMETIRPHLVPIIGKQERLRDMKEPMERDIDDMFPLAVCHSRHRRIVVQTCIIHHN